jgi:hypothetical protein
MKTIYKRLIGLLMASPGLCLLYLAHANMTFDVTLAKIIISITSMFISIIVSIFFLYGAWLFIEGPED